MNNPDTTENSPQYEDKQFWGEHDLDNTGAGAYNIGPLYLRCRVKGDELWLAQYYKPEKLSSDDPKVKEALSDDSKIKWSRWAATETPKKIRFTPVFPEKPVLVKPDYPFRLVSAAKARVYVRVPLRVRVEILTNDYNTLTEIPIIVCSLTWFGAFTGGELCYWITSSARRKAEPDPKRPYMALCPVFMKNNSAEELFFEKLCLRVEALSIYSYEDQLWGNETVVSYKGSENISDIEILKGAPKEISKSAALLSDPLNPGPRGFTSRTFTSLKGFKLSGLFSGQG